MGPAEAAAPTAGPLPPDRRATPAQPRRPLRLVELLVVAVVAALVAAGATIAVARATGWGATATTSPTHSTRGLGPTTNNVQAVLAHIYPSVVAVTATMTATQPTTPFREGTLTSVGTGVAVSRQGEVVTNDHVVRGASAVQVTLAGSAKPTGATIVGESSSHDLALLQLDGSVDLTPATFADSSAVRVGDEVIAVGYALGLEGGPTVTDGIISATGRKVATEATGAVVTLTDMLQTDAAISSGNSGGPLVDAQGKVVGVNTAVATSNGTTTAQNIGFAIPAATVEQQLPSLRAG